MMLPNQLINVLRTDLEIYEISYKLHAFGFYMCVRFSLRLLKIRKKHRTSIGQSKYKNK